MNKNSKKINFTIGRKVNNPVTFIELEPKDDDNSPEMIMFNSVKNICREGEELKDVKANIAYWHNKLLKRENLFYRIFCYYEPNERRKKQILQARWIENEMQKNFWKYFMEDTDSNMDEIIRFDWRTLSWIYYLFEQSAGSINVLNNMIDEFTNNSKFTINAWFKILNETELEQFSSPANSIYELSHDIGTDTLTKDECSRKAAGERGRNILKYLKNNLLDQTLEDDLKKIMYLKYWFDHLETEDYSKQREFKKKWELGLSNAWLQTMNDTGDFTIVDNKETILSYYSKLVSGTDTQKKKRARAELKKNLEGFLNRFMKNAKDNVKSNHEPLLKSTPPIPLKTTTSSDEKNFKGFSRVFNSYQKSFTDRRGKHTKKKINVNYTQVTRARIGLLPKSTHNCENIVNFPNFCQFLFHSGLLSLEESVKNSLYFQLFYALSDGKNFIAKERLRSFIFPYSSSNSEKWTEYTQIQKNLENLHQKYQFKER